MGGYWLRVLLTDIPLLGWGIGVAANAWDVYRPDFPSEERIQQEMDRLRRPS